MTILGQNQTLLRWSLFSVIRLLLVFLKLPELPESYVFILLFFFCIGEQPYFYLGLAMVVVVLVHYQSPMVNSSEVTLPIELPCPIIQGISSWYYLMRAKVILFARLEVWMMVKVLSETILSLSQLLETACAALIMPTHSAWKIVFNLS